MVLYLILTALIALGLVIFLSRLILLINCHREYLYLQLSILNCGLLYHSQNGIGIILGKWDFYSKKATGRKLKKVAKKTDESKLPSPRKKLPLYVTVRIIKALVLFLARLAAGTSMDRVNLKLVPADLNPALAGFSFGLNAALAGIFPGWGRSVSYQPFGAQAGAASKYSGEMEFSIPNRKIFYICYQLWRDLPIWEITKTYMSGKRGK